MTFFWHVWPRVQNRGNTPVNFYSHCMEEDPQLWKGVAEIGRFEKDYFEQEDFEAFGEFDGLAAVVL